jgi:drug/metabolite transporter (DMT)-like permease
LALPLFKRLEHTHLIYPLTTLNKRIGLVQIHTAALLAGFTGLFAKFLEVSPAVITAGRTVFGSLALLIAAKLMGLSLRVSTRRDMLVLALSGVVLAIHWFTFFRSIQISTVAVGLLAFSTFPLFVTFLEPLVFRERFHFFDAFTAAVVVVGLVLICPTFDLGSHTTRGVLWGVISGFAYALLSLLSRSCVRTLSALAVTFYQQAFAALLVLPAMLSFRGTLSARTLLLLLVLGVVFTALAQALFVGSLRHIRAQMASVIIGLEPVYGILFAVALLHEMPSLRTLLGGVLICGAVLATTLKHINLSLP